MPMLLRNLRLGINEPEDLLRERAARKLGLRPDEIRVYSIVRRSIDARDHDDIHLVYHVQLALYGGAREEKRRIAYLRSGQGAFIEPSPSASTAAADRSEVEDQPSAIGHRQHLNDPPPVIVGFGPAGMFAALALAEAGLRPVVLERGRPVRRRHRDIMQTFYRQGVFDPESNLLFGEGGAGAYSDGKLYTRVSDPRVHQVLETLYHHGADPDILIDAHPHIGSDKLPTICVRIRDHIEKLGGKVRFEQCVEDFEINDGRLSALHVNGQRMEVGPVILAVGHSARDTIRRLVQIGVKVVAKPFQMGVRIEHPQAMADRWQYGALCGHERLPPAEYHLVAKGAAPSGGDVFSFCMCPGGLILPTMEQPGLISTNGASRSSRSSPFANSGLVITVNPDHFDNDPIKGLEYQERWERAAFEATRQTYRVPCQRAVDFMADRASDGTMNLSYPLGGQWCDTRQVIPESVAAALIRGLAILDRRLPGFAGPDAIITAPETRASAPVRILRDPQTLQSVNTAGLYPVGEGAGYAGGIVSAAIDGLNAAERLITVG